MSCSRCGGIGDLRTLHTIKIRGAIASYCYKKVICFCIKKRSSSRAPHLRGKSISSRIVLVDVLIFPAVGSITRLTHGFFFLKRCSCLGFSRQHVYSYLIVRGRFSPKSNIFTVVNSIVPVPAGCSKYKPFCQYSAIRETTWPKYCSPLCAAGVTPTRSCAIPYLVKCSMMDHE